MVRKFGISFGLVNIPVQIHSTVDEETISFNMITPAGNRVKQKIVDAETGEEVNRAETKKGYEVSKGKYVILTQEEVANVKLASTKSIEIIGFAPAAHMEAILQKERYYIIPDGKPGEKGYSILYHVLKELSVIAVGKIVMGGTKEYIATVSVWNSLLLLTLLYYPHEIVTPPVPNMAEISDRERELGKALLQSLGKPDLKELVNRYIKAVEELVTAKQEGREIKSIKVQETATDDIAAALEKSLALPKKKKKLGVAVAVDGSTEMVEV